ncbi:V-type ATP synthase subunit D [Saccharolobus solfataricus]|uniref:A-type ATP synthase subunit D n=3 Tax=Saccharolobus solfataricus TaxID=2287 RepID=AATD_SACS2|nr:V-type ATP synthase subunit D [Saccharolobus solfataricus]Q9UWW9.1 RecName: Full=V-type ATP synthase subunit D; AltName: Full=V-ATPase subunit D [Saccharolobus solfataricus P2]AAK40881.1 ATP synthase subunit D (atpD) [Saccharolobus solfataricus P2]AKA73911.1 V-type ATP synthase subunit D [Saccharolobus solfataricus]AKA76609.1 V-type ATP synthase subunit D [Saccharolobus solfataricus]AKA79302.1 V-type ATP synthase subunit D [Saccharolobus solfataricus]AZF68387.1 V-type ATP synthase subunit 
MSQKVLPTKINLIQFRRQLRLITVIKRLLENKREVLLLYLRTYASQYEKIYNEVNEEMKKVYESYLQAVASEGISNIEEMALSQKPSLEVNSAIKVIFGVKVPTIRLDKSTIPAKPFSDVETSPYLSESYEEMTEALNKIIELVELESTIRSLVSELRKTQRLINSIDNYILPFYRGSIKFIKQILEDRQREEFSRLKIIRRILQRRRESGSR